MNPLVSIIVTSYNQPIFLDRAITSAINQTYENTEVIIADDNSPNPEVYNVIKKYLNNPKIKYFNSDISDEERLLTTRYATQINTAVRDYSNGEYISYLADDDYYYPEMIEKMMNYVNSTLHDVIFCAQHIKNIDGNIDGGGLDGRGVRFFETPLIRGADKLDHNQVVTSRASFDTVGGWNDEEWCWSGADAIYFDRLEKAGFLFYPIDNSEPLQAKMYRENSVQWNMANGLSPIGSD